MADFHCRMVSGSSIISSTMLILSSLLCVKPKKDIWGCTIFWSNETCMFPTVCGVCNETGDWEKLLKKLSSYFIILGNKMAKPLARNPLCCAVLIITFLSVARWCILRILPVWFSKWSKTNSTFTLFFVWRELSPWHLHVNLSSRCYYTYTNQHCISISKKIEQNQTHIYIQTYVSRKSTRRLFKHQKSCSVTKHIIPLIKLTHYTWVVLPKDTNPQTP